MTGRWTLQPILDSYLLVGLLALCLLLSVCWPLYRRLATGRRAVLLALRGAVILLIVLAMLRPTFLSTSTQPQPAVLLVLFDQSRSMQLPDAGGETSRWEAQRDVLRAVEPLLRDLGQRIQVKVYGYDQQLHPLDLAQGPLPLDDPPAGEQTDLGTVLSDALRRETGQRLAGIVLLGDGAQTAVAPQVELMQAGREAARLGLPLYTVAFGPPGNQAEARDVAIDNLPEKYTAFVKNQLQIRGQLRVRGYVNQPLPVELVVDAPDGNQQVLGPLTLTARSDGQQVPVELTFVPQQVGQYKLTLRATPQPGELVTKNNQLSAFLTVLEGGLNVLYLEGEYRNETRFLLRALDSSPDIQVRFDILEKSQRADWPVNLGGELSDPKYDAFILGDLDAAALGPGNLQQLAAVVQQGKGLIMLGGLHSFGPGGYRGTPLEDVLPITIGRLERQDFDAPIRPDLHIQQPLQLLPARPHPIMQLAPGGENLEAWKRLPPLQGANRFEGLKEHPSVQVIGESPDGIPLLVTSEYVRGRVAALAGDSTWLWAMQGFGAQHKRFWRQVVLWLARRDEQQEDNVWIKLQQRRYRAGSRVVFTAGALSATGDAIAGAQLEAELRLPDNSRVPVRLSAEEEHQVGAVDVVEQAGDYLLEVRATLDGRPLGTAQADFQVLDEDLELSNPAADPDQLARLASLTREFDGRSVLPEQLPELLREIQRRPPEVEVEIQSKWQLGATAVDAWLLLLVLAGLLAAEWALRKRWGLV